jgi:hypothetical protein
MAGALRTGFARESLTWGFAKGYAAGGTDSRDSARLDATFRHVSAIDPRNPLHSGTSVPAPRARAAVAPCGCALLGRCPARRAPPSRDLAPDLPLRSGLSGAQGASRSPRAIVRCADARGQIQLRPAATRVYRVRIWPLILKAPCLPVRETGRFQRYERGRERQRAYGRLVPQLTQKLPSFSVPHAGQCQVCLGVNAGGTDGAGACCCAAAAGASGAGAGV